MATKTSMEKNGTNAQAMELSEHEALVIAVTELSRLNDVLYDLTVSAHSTACLAEAGIEREDQDGTLEECASLLRTFKRVLGNEYDECVSVTEMARAALVGK